MSDAQRSDKSSDDDRPTSSDAASTRRKSSDLDSRGTGQGSGGKQGVVYVPGSRLPDEMRVLDKPIAINYWWAQEGRR